MNTTETMEVVSTKTLFSPGKTRERDWIKGLQACETGRKSQKSHAVRGQESI